MCNGKPPVVYHVDVVLYIHLCTHVYQLMILRFFVVPCDSASVKLLEITTFIGDKNN